MVSCGHRNGDDGSGLDGGDGVRSVAREAAARLGAREPDVPRARARERLLDLEAPPRDPDVARRLGPGRADRLDRARERVGARFRGEKRARIRPLRVSAAAERTPGSARSSASMRAARAGRSSEGPTPRYGGTPASRSGPSSRPSPSRGSWTRGDARTAPRRPHVGHGRARVVFRDATRREGYERPAPRSATGRVVSRRGSQNGLQLDRRISDHD